MHVHKVTTCQELPACHVQTIVPLATQQLTACLVWRGISFQVEVARHVRQLIPIVNIVHPLLANPVNLGIF